MEIPANAFIFFGTVQNNKIAGDLKIFSGKINTTGGPGGATGFLYSGSNDNPIISSQEPSPLFSWDFISDGTVGNGDNLACEEAQGPTTEPGFIALIERGGCPFTDKLLNASKAGAIAGIIFNNQGGGDTFVNMRTPGSDIPGAFIRRSDGIILLSYADQNIAVPGAVKITPTNVLGSVNGSFSTSPKGVLRNISLNLVISDQDDHIFAGEIRRKIR